MKMPDKVEKVNFGQIGPPLIPVRESNTSLMRRPWDRGQKPFFPVYSRDSAGSCLIMFHMSTAGVRVAGYFLLVFRGRFSTFHHATSLQGWNDIDSDRQAKKALAEYKALYRST